MLKKIEFENYRCFQNTTLDFRDITIIVGKNNAGKSTIIEALRLVAAAERKSRTTIVYKHPPADLHLPLVNKGFYLDISKLKIDLRNIIYFYNRVYAKVTATFKNESKITIYLNSETVFVTLSDSSGVIMSSRTQSNQLSIGAIDILPQIGLIKENEKLLNEHTIKSDKETYLSSRHFRNELLLFRKDYFDDFKRIAESTWPGLRIRSLDYNPNDSEYISLLVQDDGFPAEIGLMGSGLQMWLQIIWFITRCAECKTIILDEPDVYMHPDMQRKILDIIKDKYQQIIIATHSVEIISAVDERCIVTIDKTAKRMKYANSSKAVQGIIDGLGSVHNLALVRLANSKKCLFVEGKDLKILSRLKEKLGIREQQPLETLPCIPLGGFSKLNEAYGASKLFHEETDGAIVCHCILDRDYFPAEFIDGQMKSAQDAHLHLHIWEKKEIENYLLIPEAIFRIIDKPYSEYEVFCAKLEALIDSQKDEVVLQFANQLQIQDLKRKDLGSYVKNARGYVEQSWGTLEQNLSIIGGKYALSLINSWIKNEYNKHCSQAKILSAIKSEDINSEMVEVIRTLCS